MITLRLDLNPDGRSPELPGAVMTVVMVDGAPVGQIVIEALTGYLNVRERDPAFLERARSAATAFSTAVENMRADG